MLLVFKTSLYARTSSYSLINDAKRHTPTFPISVRTTKTLLAVYKVACILSLFLAFFPGFRDNLTFKYSTNPFKKMANEYILKVLNNFTINLPFIITFIFICLAMYVVVYNIMNKNITPIVIFYIMAMIIYVIIHIVLTQSFFIIHFIKGYENIIASIINMVLVFFVSKHHLLYHRNKRTNKW